MGDVRHRVNMLHVLCVILIQNKMLTAEDAKTKTLTAEDAKDAK